MTLDNAPFVKIATLFIFGIILSKWVNISLYTSIILLAFAFILLVFFIAYYNRQTSSIGVTIIIILLGIINVKISDDRLNPIFFAKHKSQYLLLEVNDNIKEIKKGSSFWAKVRGISPDGNNFINSVGRLNVISFSDYKPKVGDILITKSKYNKIANKVTITRFNNTQFLANNNIYYEQYINNDDFYVAGKRQSIYRIATNLNHKIQELFNNSLSIKAANFANAYILGAKKNLSYDDKSKFAVSGVMHILSVSGLHVGMLFFILTFSFSYIYRFKYSESVNVILIICLLMLYACVTNLAPSVSRATIMLSLALIARLFYIRSNVYNIIFASMFIILLFKPKDIYNVGFQLSYMAVIGIVAIQSIFAKYIKLENVVLRYIFGVIIISLAAQIATSFLSIFYFNRFPTYFLIANIAIIPLAWVTMASLIALLIFYYIPIVAPILIFINEKLINAIYAIIDFISNLPYSSVNIWLDHITVALLYVIIICFIVYLITKKNYALNILLLGIVFLFFYLIILKFNAINKKELIVYDYTKSKLIGLIANGKYKLISNQLKDDDNWVSYYRLNKLSPDELQNLYVSDNVIVFENKIILLIDKNNQQNITLSKRPFKVDYVIVSNNAKANIGLIKFYNKPDLIIIDSTNSINSIKHLESECVSTKSLCYVTKYKGDLIIKI